jgi:3-hydroxy-9,10-secoandrosta-1,3,5(10)-triene-9,17-dione monooxygenase reductase component
MKPLEKNALRQALGQFATGVTIVTTAGPGGTPIGVTANSFSSVSLEPPMVLWSLAAAAYSRSAFETAGYFCVHVLTAAQEELSRRFATQGSDKFAGVSWSPGLGHAPMLDEYVARFQCRNSHHFPVGDHIVMVGEVLEFDLADSRPLVFHGGRYAHAERRLMASIARQLGEEDRRPDERRKNRTLRS